MAMLELRWIMPGSSVSSHSRARLNFRERRELPYSHSIVPGGLLVTS
jgi:hypothetical protein